TEIIQSWKVTAEEHYIVTDDGYVLLLERAFSTVSRKYPIIITHGIAMNGLAYVMKQKIFLLTELGYDVWVLNFRGTWYSRGHMTLNFNDAKYWTYSINELGVHDINKALKHVYKETKEKAIYIGFSMGTTSFFIHATTFPNITQQYVKGMIGLAPVINFKGITSIAKYSGHHLVWPILRFFIYRLWNGKMLPGFSKIFSRFITSSYGMYAAQLLLNLLFGYDYQQMDPYTFPLYPYWIDTVGAEVYSHYVQIYQDGVFQNYDHGTIQNVINYGRIRPPSYNLSNVAVPVALFVGANDILATPTNAEQLYSELPKTSRCGYHVIEFEKWNHIDFISAKDLNTYLYTHLFEVIEEMESGT
ncbi:hypothetical protein NQ318_007461, partial [Aromia moschata]